jgi:hypothetical protein
MHSPQAGNRTVERGGEDVRGDDRFSGANDPEQARSALNLRLVLALIGILAFAFIAVMLARMDVPTLLVVVPLLFAVVGLVDLGIVIGRLRSGRR